MPRLRALLPDLLLAAAALLLPLLLAEAGLRLTGWRPERQRVRVRLANVPDLSQRANALELDCYASNPRGYFDVDLRRPDVQARYRALGIRDFSAALPDQPWCLEFRFNALAVRGPEYGPRQPGRRRVVVLGDSFTEGQGVRAGDVYSSVLQARLEALAPGRYEVLNYGRRGHDFPELYELFESAQPLQPDLVVYGFVLNDADRSPEFDRLWPELNDWIMVRRPPVLLGPLSPRLLAWFRERLDERRIARQTTQWYLDMYDRPNEAGWARTREYLSRMKAAQEAHGGQLLVALWPLLVGLEGRYPFADVHERLRRVCERRGIPCVDLLPSLAGRSSASLWAEPGDWHPNEVAHRLAAEALVPEVRRLLDGP